MTKKVKITIDGKQIEADSGEILLWAALRNDIYIPHLCAIQENEEPYTSCRMCFVEVEGIEKPVTACTQIVSEGMVVNTRGEKSLELVKTGFELIMASHDLDCKNCAKNGNCELQKIAKHLKVSLKPKRFEKILRDLPVDDSHADFSYNPNRCVLCGRCTWTCKNKLGHGTLGFSYRGFKRRVTILGDKPMGEAVCDNCLECVKACPVGALVIKNKDRK